MKILNVLNNTYMWILILFGLLFTSSLQAQTTQDPFNVTPKFPKGGERITLTYDAEDTILKDRDSLCGIVYTYADFKWKIEDVNLKETAKNQWEAQLDLEPKAALVNCIFYANDTIDRGGAKTYTWMIGNEPGSYSGWGLMRNPTFNQEFPQKLDSLSFITDKVTLMWINNEIRNNPSSRAQVFYEGLSLKKQSSAEDQTGRIIEEIKYIATLPLDVEQQYDLQRTLNLIDQEENKTFLDSVKQVLLTKYPHGVLARDRAIKKLSTIEDADKKLAAFKAFQKNFPEEKFKEVRTYTEDLYYDKLYKGIAYTNIANKKDYDFVFDNLKTTPYTALIDYSWHLVSIPYNNERMSLDSLNLFAGKIITELERREQLVPNEFIHTYSPKQWKQKALESAYGEYLTYAKILEKVEDYDKEAYYLEKIKPLLIYTNTDFNELYTRHLVRSGKPEAAVAFIKESLKENNTSPAMLSILKTDFLKKGKKESEFQDYVTSLKSEDAKENQKSELIASLINKPIAGFSLESSYGTTVDLKDQKGKIVVIDMWATWCAPCKKAMPGMKMVVDQYAGDNGVKFYFLDTQEYTKDYKAKTAAFIQENGYPFEVLYDAKNPETGKLDATYSKYAKAFQFSGIPQKMIIDQKGNLRWRSTGYEGSPSELADEISIIITYLKAEEKS